EDTVFITNRLVTVGNVPTLSPSRPHEAMIWVKLGAYARTVAVTVFSAAISGGSQTISYTTGDGSNSADSQGVGTDRIANGLYSATNPQPGRVVISGTQLSNLTT